jgi:hypothetical protein
MAGTVWDRWMALARKAAAVQSNVILWLLYYVLFLPIALIQRPFSDPLGTQNTTAPHWRERSDGPQDTKAAGLQF